MKIFLISTFFHPVTGGVETHVLNLAKQIQNAGHSVEVLTSDSAKNGPRISESKSVVLGIKVKHFRNILNLSYYHKFFPGLFWYLLRNDFDIAHVHGFRKMETYMAMLACKLKKKKLILTTHNPFPTNSRSKTQDSFIVIHDKTVGKWFTSKIDTIICLVKSEVKIFTDIYKVPEKKLVVIPNGIEAEYFEPGDSKRFLEEWEINRSKWDAIVLGAGRISESKGFQNLFETIKKMRHVLFFIAGGDDGYLPQLKAKFAGVKNIIFSEVFLPREKMRDAYAAADIFVFPSKHEAYGIVALEAMAQGTPVISTNIGGPAELFNNGSAILINPDLPDEWTAAISNLLDNDKLRQEMVNNGKIFASKLHWDSVGKKIINLYNQIQKNESSGNIKK